MTVGGAVQNGDEQDNEQYNKNRISEYNRVSKVHFILNISNFLLSP